MTIDAGENVQCELFWALNDDLLALRVPTNHMVVFGLFKKTGEVQKEKWVSFEADVEKNGAKLEKRLRTCIVS